jgi:hypothetical protein
MMAIVPGLTKGANPGASSDPVQENEWGYYPKDLGVALCVSPGALPSSGYPQDCHGTWRIGGDLGGDLA